VYTVWLYTESAIYSTILVEPGSEATMTSKGDLIIQVSVL